MIPLTGLRTGDCTLTVEVAVRVLYKEPPMSTEVARRRSEFERWLKNVGRKFAKPTAEAIERHILRAKADRAARAARKGGGDEG